jgi:hypothetical protein
MGYTSKYAETELQKASDDERDYEGARIRNPGKQKKKYGIGKDGEYRTKKEYVLSGDREKKRSKHRAAIWGASAAAIVSAPFINKK